MLQRPQSVLMSHHCHFGGSRLGQHVADVRSTCWIRKDCGFQLLSRQALTDRQAEDVDDILRIRPDQMRAKDALASLLDEYFKAVGRFCDASRRVPIGSFLVLDSKSKSVL